MLIFILIDDVDIDADVDVDAFFFSVARQKRRIITQRWRKSSGHRGLEPANLAVGTELV